MKKTFLIMGVVLIGLSSCQKDEVVTRKGSLKGTLSTAEIDDLTFLIQEEKLARDVYIYAYEKYGQTIFDNISESEQSHMDAVASLMNRYGVSNPAIGLEAGEFVNEDLQQLYFHLSSKADESLVQAYTVGATIEDLDIHDIEGQYANTSNEDLLTIYDRLICGSRNHLRSFNDMLLQSGAGYEPQFISWEQFDAIIHGENEGCH